MDQWGVPQNEIFVKTILETPRLLLRTVDEQDVQGFFELDSDPEVVRYVGSPPIKSPEQSLEIIHSIQKQYHDFGMGRWTVLSKETGEFLGWCGLKRMAGITVNGFTDHVDIGYRFLRKHWGAGYATESAQATLDYGFQALKLSEIYAMADLENLASQHVLNKIGLKRENEFQWEGNSCVWFSKHL